MRGRIHRPRARQRKKPELEEDKAKVYAHNPGGDRASLGQAQGRATLPRAVIEPLDDDTVVLYAGEIGFGGLQHKGITETL
jgi:hypothetical protein